MFRWHHLAPACCLLSLDAALRFPTEPLSPGWRHVLGLVQAREGGGWEHPHPPLRTGRGQQVVSPGPWTFFFTPRVIRCMCRYTQLYSTSEHTCLYYLFVFGPFLSCVLDTCLSFRFGSVAQSCPTLRRHRLQLARFPVHHQLPELAQTHVHSVGDATQPTHPLSSPSPPAFYLSQHQGLFK